MEKPENSLENKLTTFLSRLQKLGFLSIILTLTICLFGLLGWYFKIQKLLFVAPSSHPMHPKTGIGLLFSTFALILFSSKEKQKIKFFLVQCFSAIAFLIGSWTIVEYLVGKILMIEQGRIYFVPNDPTKYFQPSPETAFCLMLSAAAIFFMNSTSSRLRTFSEASVLISGGIALFSVAGLLTGANSLYSFILPTQAIGMALQSALAFIFLSIGTLSLTPQEGIISIFVSDSLGGVVARKLVLIFLFVPMLLELVAGELVKSGFINQAFRQSLIIVCVFSIFIFLSWVTAKTLDEIDKDRKRLQINLSESEEKYRSLIELAPESIFIADKTGKYIEVNEAACNLLKYSKEEIVGKTIIDLIPEEENERLENSKKYMEGSGKTDVSEWKLRRGDGQFVDVEVSAKILSHDRWVAFVRNIEERKKMERSERILALVGKMLPEILDRRESLKRAAEMVASEIGDWCTVSLINDDSKVEQLIVHHRDSGKSDVANELMNLPITGVALERIKKIVGTKEGQLIVKNDFNFFLEEVLQSGRYKLFQKLGLHSVCHVPLIARGRAFGLFTIANSQRDFTRDEFDLIKLVVEQISLSADNAYLYQEATKATKIREDMMAIVSHDLKNPLTVVDLGAQSLKKLVADNKSIDEIKTAISKTSQRIDSSVKRSLALITDLLTYSKIESGVLVLDVKELDVVALVEETIENHQLLAQNKGVELSYFIEEPHLKIKADHSKLLQVLSNLVGNSLKFTENSGTIKIRISRKSNEEILFQVTDTGSGIKEEELQHIFDRYWQPARTQTQGSGLGLAIAKGVVDAHHGHIWVESTFGKGSTFNFTIPS